jgi:hypothetical protein
VEKDCNDIILSAALQNLGFLNTSSTGGTTLGLLYVGSYAAGGTPPAEYVAFPSANVGGSHGMMIALTSDNYFFRSAWCISNDGTKACVGINWGNGGWTWLSLK